MGAVVYVRVQRSTSGVWSGEMGEWTKKEKNMSLLAVDDAKELVAELCAGLYTQGHVSGTGGGISIKAGDRSCLNDRHMR